MPPAINSFSLQQRPYHVIIFCHLQFCFSGRKKKKRFQQQKIVFLLCHDYAAENELTRVKLIRDLFHQDGYPDLNFS